MVYLEAVAPGFWSKERCPQGPLGAGWEGSHDFISERMLPMFAEITALEWRFFLARTTTLGRKRTPLLLHMTHSDGNQSRLKCDVAEEWMATVECEIELWWRATRPRTSPAALVAASNWYGASIVAFAVGFLKCKCRDGPTVLDAGGVGPRCSRTCWFLCVRAPGRSRGRMQFLSHWFEWMGNGRSVWSIRRHASGITHTKSPYNRHSGNRYPVLEASGT
jgi:hypothetical protein